MKRSGFTLIELVFVIVVLGILAAVAVPRLSGVQDDALVATEDAGVGAIRSGLQGLRGKIILASGREFNIILNSGVNARTGYATVRRSNIVSGNLKDLSVDGEIQWDKEHTLTQTAENKDGTLCTVLEPEGRTQWKTKRDASNANNTRMAGPASSTLEVTGYSFERPKYNKLGSWLYSPSSGVVAYQSNIKY